MSKLHELLAVENDRKAAAAAVLNETLAVFKKNEPFMGQHAEYIPFAEGALDATAETQEMVTTVPAKLEHCFDILGRALDVTASKDATNQTAKADIIVDGETLATDVPATALLSLESSLKSWVPMFQAIPTLAPGRAWVADEAKGEDVFTDPQPETRFRTQKVLGFMEVAPPTTAHKAQVETYNTDKNVGKIVTTKWSGMMSPADKSALLSRVMDLMAAVKEARQRANSAEVVQLKVSASLTQYLLQGH